MWTGKWARRLLDRLDDELRSFNFDSNKILVQVDHLYRAEFWVLDRQKLTTCIVYEPCL